MKQQKVDYKGLAPSTARKVKAAYRIGLSNGRALQRIADGKALQEAADDCTRLAVARDNALAKSALYIQKLGEPPNSNDYVARCQCITNVEGGLTGQCTLSLGHESDHTWPGLDVGDGPAKPVKAGDLVRLPNGRVGRVMATAPAPEAEDPCIACEGKPSPANSPCVVCGAIA